MKKLKPHQKKIILNICFMGGSQAGVIGALALLSMGHRITAAVSYSEELTAILHLLRIPVYRSIQDMTFLRDLKKSDILISVHGKEIVKVSQFNLPRLGGINVHPYLYKYKGADPVKRALIDNNYKGSVGVHKMEAKVDSGEVLAEEFVDLSGAVSPEEAYNKLYPYYFIALSKALRKIGDKRDDEF